MSSQVRGGGSLNWGNDNGGQKGKDNNKGFDKI